MTQKRKGSRREPRFLVWLGFTTALIGALACLKLVALDWIIPGTSGPAARGGAENLMVVTTGKGVLGSWVQILAMVMVAVLLLVALVGPRIRRVLGVTAAALGAVYAYIGFTFTVTDEVLSVASSVRDPARLTSAVEKFGIAGLALLLGGLLIAVFPGTAQALQSHRDLGEWVVIARRKDPTRAH